MALVRTEIDNFAFSGETSRSISLGASHGYHGIEIFFFGRSDRASSQDTLRLRLNSDSGSNYANAFAIAGGGGGGGDFDPETYLLIGPVPGASAPTSYASTIRGSMMGISQTSLYKSVECTAQYSTSATIHRVYQCGGIWRNTAEVTDLQFLSGTGSGFDSGSRLIVIGLST